MENFGEESNSKHLTETTTRKILFERGQKNIVTVTLPEGHVNDLHDHPFDADAIVIAGSLKLVVFEKVYNLKSGDEFQLNAGIKHPDFIGKHGVTLVVACSETTENNSH